MSKRSRSAVRVIVRVMGTDRTPSDQPASVTLNQEARETVHLSPRAGGNALNALYEAWVPPGRYLLNVQGDAGISSHPREVLVSGAGYSTPAYLGREDWPRYHIGDNIVRFEPKDDIIGIALEDGPLNARDARVVAQDLIRQIEIEPIELGVNPELPFATSDGSLWLFRGAAAASGDRERLATRIGQAFDPRRVRVGTAVDLSPGSVTLLDGRFVLRLPDEVSLADLDQALAERSASRKHSVIVPNMWVVEFSGGNYREHLATVEDWIARFELLSGEPDLIIEIEDDAPNDPEYSDQSYLTRQGFDQAWAALKANDPSIEFGSDQVCVATFDRGTEPHRDTADFVDAYCFDFARMIRFSDPCYGPEGSHGMAVYGIVAACADNCTDVTGITPHAKQIIMARPTFYSIRYPCALLWAAGLKPDKPDDEPAWPDLPPTPADVINCSHCIASGELSDAMAMALDRLENEGCNGRGTIVIYAVGNYGQDFTGIRSWAEQETTLAVTNTQIDNLGNEVINPKSNYGPKTDLCALGTGAITLDVGNGTLIFDGTSAAAPMVSAAAALVRAVDPKLSPGNIREILRTSADKIDLVNGSWVDGFSEKYGYGRLNAGKAVVRAIKEMEMDKLKVAAGWTGLALVVYAVVLSGILIMFKHPGAERFLELTGLVLSWPVAAGGLVFSSQALIKAWKRQ